MGVTEYNKGVSVVVELDTDETENAFPGEISATPSGNEEMVECELSLLDISDSTIYRIKRELRLEGKGLFSRTSPILETILSTESVGLIAPVFPEQGKPEHNEPYDAT